jgi:hypothetical protein
MKYGCKFILELNFYYDNLNLNTLLVTNEGLDMHTSDTISTVLYQ